MQPRGSLESRRRIEYLALGFVAKWGFPYFGELRLHFPNMSSAEVSWLSTPTVLVIPGVDTLCQTLFAACDIELEWIGPREPR
jgi:hypothetical protein